KGCVGEYPLQLDLEAAYKAIQPKKVYVDFAAAEGRPTDFCRPIKAPAELDEPGYNQEGQVLQLSPDLSYGKAQPKDMRGTNFALHKRPRFPSASYKPG
ncbi:unnamed protein product, partial [Chrysoparadoxa australica]